MLAKNFHNLKSRCRFFSTLFLIGVVVFVFSYPTKPARADVKNPDVTDTTSVPGYTILKWTTVGSGTWTVPAGVTEVEYLVVGGGGSGGYGNSFAVTGAGGGGAGGFLTENNFAVSGSLDVTVGTGGLGQSSNKGNDGASSILGTSVVALGGGGGGYNVSYTGQSGGSGGGAGNGDVGTYGNGTSGQGNRGGDTVLATGPSRWLGGGGGGAGGLGQSATSSKAGDGGLGRESTITGSSVFYAGGGGGASTNSNPGLGGSGGGGAGSSSGAGNAGLNNFGGGGGAGQPSGSGGSGIVIIKYSNAPTISSVTDSPDPAAVGSNINFSVNWNGGSSKIHICKTNSITASTQTCDGGSWCDSVSFTGTSPATCSYTAQSGDEGGIKNYFAFVCDSSNLCSSSTAGTFSVNHYSPIIFRRSMFFRNANVTIFR